MAILTGIAGSVCLLCLVFFTLFESMQKRSLKDGFSVGFFFSLLLTILLAGHWLAVLLGRL